MDDRGGILVIDTDNGHRKTIEDALLEAGYRVESIAHEAAVAHISREDMSRYSAVVVALSASPSTLSSSYRMGEYVLHYMAQMCSEMLPRVVILSAVPDFEGPAAEPCRLLLEPLAGGQLLAEIRSIAR